MWDKQKEEALLGKKILKSDRDAQCYLRNMEKSRLVLFSNGGDSMLIVHPGNVSTLS